MRYYIAFIIAIFIYLFISCDDGVFPIKIKSSITQINDSILYPPDSIHYLKIDRFFKRKLKNRSFNGNVLISKNGEILYKECLGYRNLWKKDTLDFNTVFELASVSKPITATAILLLAQNNKLSLDDTINKFFKGFPYKNITIRHLLCHRGGLTNYMYFMDKHWNNKKAYAKNNDVIELMIKKEPKVYYLPDRRYNYSNTGYCLLSEIVEKVSGMTFGNYLDKMIFKPNEMHYSMVYDTSLNKNNDSSYAIGHMKNGRIAKKYYLNGVYGDKGIMCSIEDLYKFNEALLSYKIINKTFLDQAFKPMHKDLHIWDNYGLGWRINAKDPKNKIIYHTGWWKGYRSYYINKINTKETIIVLSNTTRGSFLKLKDLLDLL